jgi:Cof subfamily protein (haloacid dehalogenase superfamily)
MFDADLPDKLLLVCDMDGTLLDVNRQVSMKNRFALERFANNGGSFTIATGRSIEGVAQFIDILPVNAPVILFNGAVIYDFVQKKILYESILEENIRDIIFGVLTHFPDAGMEIFNRYGISLIRENDVTKAHMTRESFSDRILLPDDVPMPWYKVLFAWEPDKLPILEEYLKVNAQSFNLVHTEVDMIELVGRNTSKGTALKKLLSLTGFEASAVIDMGDNTNDLDMLETAGIGIAVANAHPAVREMADCCCCHHDDDAVSQVIGWVERGVL